MKVVIAQEELVKLIGRVQNIVVHKGSMPILSNFQIEAVNGSIILTATDLIVGVKCSAPAKVLEEGGTTLNAKHFSQLVRELTSANVELTTDQHEITEIVANSSRFRINGMSKEEFPIFPDLTGAVKVTMTQGRLRDLLYRTAFAVAAYDERFTMMGVLVRIHGDQAMFVGTDGKRLAKSEASLQLDSSADSIDGDYVIPLKAVEEMIKNLRDDEECEVTLSLLPDKVAMEVENTVLIAKLVIGDYPDFQSVIPDPSDTVLRLHREQLTSLLRQVALFTPDSNHSARFTFSDGELRLSTNSTQLGEGKVSMPVNYSGDQLDVAFNPGFFIDILRHCESETIDLELTDSYSPGKIRDQEVESTFYVLMPMRLNEA